MTLSEIRRVIRERTVRRGECRIWIGGTDGDGVPRCRDSDGQTRGVRRLLLLAKGVDLKGKVATSTCDDRLCVCELHAVAWTRQELVARGAKKQAGNLRLAMKRAANARKTGKLTMEQVRQMRAAGLTVRQAAQEFGVAFRTAQKVLSGASWKEYGSPFAGLGA